MAYDIASRKTFARPQAMIWSDRKFSFQATHGASEPHEYVPPTNLDESKLEAIVLPDHGRAPIQKSNTRIESRSRMINGTSRSYWTADKIGISTSWENLPSRLAMEGANYVNGAQIAVGTMFLADNAAPALSIIQWYETHPEPFYVYLSYDDGSRIWDGGKDYSLKRYVDEYLMYFESFNSTLEKRGLYDFWNIDLGLASV